MFGISRLKHWWQSRPRRQMIERTGDQFRLGTSQRLAIETKRQIGTINVSVSFQIIPVHGENRYNGLWWLRQINPEYERYAEANPDKKWFIVGFIPQPGQPEHKEVVLGFYSTHHRADYWLDQITLKYCTHALEAVTKCQSPSA